MKNRNVLLINPTIASSRTARFPLAVLNLAAALQQRYGTQIIDGNVDRSFIESAREAVADGRLDAVGISVMGGPQLRSAIAVSKAIRAVAPQVPIVWGGHFPTICPQESLNTDYVDYAIRGQGESTLSDLLEHVFAGGRSDLQTVHGLSWRRDGELVHNPDRSFSARGLTPALPYDQLQNPAQYLKATYLGRRTVAYQAALGCRFRCTFCGVARMFKGKTALPEADRLRADLSYLKERFNADALQFYDHNFFDREVDMVPLLEVLADISLPWWCFARSDALVNLSAESWALVRKSQLRMAYIGAESPNDQLLHDIRKGTRAEQTLAVIDKCRSNGVIPELSFMLAPPQDPEGETERTFEFIRMIKRMHPATEIMLYVYTPLPPRRHGGEPQLARPVPPPCDRAGNPIQFPETADGWAQTQWVDYWCHQDAPWVSDRLRKRILDFTTVLGCRFPTITDIRSPAWGKRALSNLASWRYGRRRYDRPWELNLSRRFIRLWDPRVSSL
jgi:radical SAM superfamily enzyme YgiQ (UPF0313 family)